MTLDEFEEARAKRKQDSERVAALLKQAPTTFHIPGMDALRCRGERMAKCGHFYKGEVCPVCHTFHAEAGSRCRDRLCPNCGWMQAVERSVAVRRALQDMGEDRMAIFHVVLTKRDMLAPDAYELHEQVKMLVDAYTRLIHKDRAIKANVWGTVRSLEISNNGEARYHPHIHALWVYKLREGATPHFITHDELCQMWQKALGVDYRPVCWIEPIYYTDTDEQGAKVTYDPSEGQEKVEIDRAVCEACKYIIKPSLYQGADVQMLVELAEGIRGVHMFQTTGAMSAAYRKAVLEIAEEREHPKGKCASCGALTDTVFLNWQNGGYSVW